VPALAAVSPNRLSGPCKFDTVASNLIVSRGTCTALSSAPPIRSVPAYAAGCPAGTAGTCGFAWWSTEEYMPCKPHHISQMHHDRYMSRSHARLHMLVSDTEWFWCFSGAPQEVPCVDHAGTKGAAAPVSARVRGRGRSAARPPRGTASSARALWSCRTDTARMR